MTTRSFIIAVLTMWTVVAVGQKNKVQAAWRGLSDYEESLKDGNPEIKYRQKAQEAIDLALVNEDTKKQVKTHAYKLRISYALFQRRIADEMKKLESIVPDKNGRAITAYGSADLSDFNRATEALNQIREMDPAYLEKLQTAISKGTSDLEEDDLKLATAMQQMKMESGNIASGKYKVQKYDEAADYFYKTAFINTILYKTKDTANFYNACVAAAKSQNTEKILEYNKKMIEAQIASPYNYESLYNVYINRKDSAAAIDALKKGRAEFPSDIGLLTQETNLFLASGRQTEALTNLQESVKRDPENALYYFIIGNIYDNLANPKDKKTGKELEKPAKFEEYFKNAETNYQKAIELNPSNKEYLYNSVYNLGAMYNNYGGYIANRKSETIKDQAKFQKENETRALVYYNKAIPHLEKALSLKPDDLATMTALRKLYLLTNNEAKAKEMSDRLKAVK